MATATVTARPAAVDNVRGAGAQPSAIASGAFVMQGLIGFCCGGLISLIGMTASAVEGLSEFGAVLALIGFGLGGAVSGCALGWGFARKHAARRSAVGFGLGMLIPAFLIPGAAEHMLTLTVEEYGIGTGVANFFAYSIAFGFAGAFASLFVAGALFPAGAIRFALSGGLGGIVLSLGPALAGDAADSDGLRAIWTMIALAVGHMIPFLLGGAWFGAAVQREQRKRLDHKRRSRGFGKS